MASIERTAYPRLQPFLSQEELETLYHPSLMEMEFVKTKARGNVQRLTLLTLLKCHQHLGYMPELNVKTSQISDYLRVRLDLSKDTVVAKEVGRSVYRYYRVIRSYLGIKRYPEGGKKIAETEVRNAAHTMSDPADLINVAIEKLIEQRFELPAFSTLNRLIGHIRGEVHEQLYSQINALLSKTQCHKLDQLLKVEEGKRFTDFNRIKQVPGPPTLKQMKLWEDQLEWLVSIIDTDVLRNRVTHTKIRQFTSEAMAFEVSDMLNIYSASKRYTLLICLIHSAQATARDQLVTFFVKRMKRTKNTAQEELRKLQEKYREIEENMITTFSEVVKKVQIEQSDVVLGQQIRALLEDHGGAGYLTNQCKLVSAYHSNNYLPLLWNIHRSVRTAIYRLTDLLKIGTATQDNFLVEALHFIKQYQSAHRQYLPYEISLEFASNRWKSFIQARHKGQTVLKRKELELCVFSYLAEGLETTDFYVVGSEQYADYRSQLLEWKTCENRLGDYCQKSGIPSNAEEFVTYMSHQLLDKARQVDEGFPKNSELTFDVNGKYHLKNIKGSPLPESFEGFKETIKSRMPERHLLDLIHRVQKWVDYTRHFGPISGSNPKLRNAIIHYLFTVFGYGCNLGAAQTARHTKQQVTQRILNRINAQHINAEKLQAALTDIINEYARFELPFVWGSGKKAISDGTHIALIENNLLGERHIRYGGYGGIAYHHISDTYIALFSRFIACGVWEAVYILDGLLNNKSKLQPDELFVDTQGQNQPAFGLSFLLGIKLMPRMRNWNDVILYRSNENITFKHIDNLFTQTIDWELIKTHWKDLMQVVLSIQAGKILPSMILQKLGVKGRKTKLYKAFRELGRVTRTLFLLELISDKSFRKEIRAVTTKIESFNNFCDFIAFGGNIIKSGDPVEQEKRIKYMNLIANAVMLHNVVDLTDILGQLAKEGHVVNKELVCRLSPYLTEHIKRYGEYVLDLEDVPKPLEQMKVVFTV